MDEVKLKRYDDLADLVEELHDDVMLLRTTMRQVLIDAQAQDVLPEWWPMMERAIAGSNARIQGASRPYSRRPLE